MSIEVIAAGLSTTIQDLGRPGHYHVGIPESGPMDSYSFIAANRMVGNADSDAGLEVTLLGPELKFQDRRLVAVTGTTLTPMVDGQRKPAWSTFVVEAGETLSFELLAGSARGYIAISGGIAVPSILGSRSTNIFGQMGGIDGRAIQVGDVLPLGGMTAGAGSKDHEFVLPQEMRAGEIEELTEVRAITGMYWHRLTPESGSAFFEDTWEVSHEANRTGIRFGGGQPVDFVPREQPFGAGSDPSNVVDCGYPYGSIQMPSGTQPIVLHRDAVSGGGYFMLGVVISADMDLLGRLRPGHKVRFTSVDMQEALQARSERNSKLSALKSGGPSGGR